STSLRGPACPYTYNFCINCEDVARPNRVRPAQFVDSQSDRTFGEVQCLHVQTHGDGGRVPATRNQSFQKCSLGVLPIQMKHLRIELVGKFDDLLLSDI